MSKNLFSDFNGTSLQEWEEKIITDLKGKPLSAVSFTNWEDITIQPHYTKEHLGSFIPASNAITNDWNITQTFDARDTKSANKSALYALKNGANSIVFTHATANEMDVLLDNIMIDIIGIHFTSSAPTEIAKALQAYCSKQAIDFTKLSGSILPLQDVATINSAIPETLAIVKGSNMQCIPVDIRDFAKYGANATQQIGIGLGLLNETIGALIPDFDIDTIAHHLVVLAATGHDYFVEIAKIRALKETFSSVLTEYGATTNTITLSTSISTLLWQETDVENNLLRGSIAGLAAATAGVHNIYIPSFKLNKTDDTSKRLSANIQLLLKEESNINKVVNVANGSYYIEFLTQELIKNSWAFFQEIEQQNGYLNSIKNGFTPEKVTQKATELINTITEGKLKIIGATVFTPDEKKLTLGDKTTVGFSELRWE